MYNRSNWPRRKGSCILWLGDINICAPDYAHNRDISIQ